MHEKCKSEFDAGTSRTRAAEAYARPSGRRALLRAPSTGRRSDAPRWIEPRSSSSPNEVGRRYQKAGQPKECAAAYQAAVDVFVSAGKGNMAANAAKKLGETMEAEGKDATLPEAIDARARRADPPLTNRGDAAAARRGYSVEAGRGDAAAATWISRKDKTRASGTSRP